MREIALTEWLVSPETQALVSYLRRRKAGVLGTFLAGTPVDPVAQGRAAAYNELETLLTSPPEEVGKILGATK